MARALIFENMLFNNKVNKEFAEKVKTVSARLGISPDWLMSVMFFESRLNPKANNPNTGARGLIQFMPSTYAQWNLTNADFDSMTAVKQLDYVEKYFNPYKGRLKNFTDLYLVTFFPLATGKPNNYTIETAKIKPETVARQNPGFDLNKDKKITVGEIKEKLKTHFSGILPESGLSILFGSKKKIGLIVGLAALVGIITYKTLKK